MFITLEGGEGAGKTTQARLLAAALARQGRGVLLTREPGGAPGAEALRAMLLGGVHRWSPAAEAHLHFAARAEHLARTILPALAAGMTVLCDRFADSTLAYQGYGQAHARPDALALIRGLAALLPRQPDRTLLLRIDPAHGAGRIARRPGAPDRYEAMDPAFHARVAQGFDAIAAAEPLRVVVVDAAADVATVHAALLRALG